MEKIKEFLPFLIPLVIVQFGLLAYTIRHILTHDSYRRGSRGLWLFVSLVGMQFWGPILYFALGKAGGGINAGIIPCNKTFWHAHRGG